MACVKSHNGKRWTICAVVCLFALFAMAKPARAENAVSVYEPVYGAENLKDGIACLIGAVGEDGRVVLMTSGVRDKKQLWAVEPAQNAQGGIELPSVDCVWQLQSNDDGTYNILTPEEKYLNTAEGVAISLDVKRKSRWNVTPSDMGFVISAVETPDRSLGLYAWVGELFFANYKHSQNTTPILQIFIPKSATPDAEIALPKPGSEVMLTMGDNAVAVSSEGLSVVTALGCRLSDGTMVVPQGASDFVCEYVDDSVFVLRNEQGFLNHSLTLAEMPAHWSLGAAGCVACDASGVEISKPYLVYNKTDGAFCFISSEDVGNVSFSPVLLSECAPEAIEETSDQGVKTLRGGWSAEALAAVSWQGVAVLDLRALALPQSTMAFRQRPTECNSPILVSADTPAHRVEAWPFVLLCEEEEARLAAAFTLSDGISLNGVRDFSAAVGQLTYMRRMHADGGWETLTLPFETLVPDGFEVCVPDEISENEITFQKVGRLEANRAAIVRYVGGSENEEPLLRLSNASERVEVAPTEMLLRGVYDTLRVDVSSAGIYLLDAEGQNFVKAAAGSWVTPFRACLCPGEDAGAVAAYSVRLSDGLPSGVEKTQCDGAALQGPCYDLQGRCLLLRTDALSFAALPAGIYIVNGKLIIKQ